VLHRFQDKYLPCGCNCALVTLICLNINPSEGHITRKSLRTLFVQTYIEKRWGVLNYLELSYVQTISYGETMLEWQVVHKYVHVHINIHSMDLCVIRRVGSGTCHKYTSTQISSVKNLKKKKKLTKTLLQIIFTHKNIHLQRKRSVYIGIFLRLILILLCYSWGSSHWVVNCWKFLCNIECSFLKTRRVGFGSKNMTIIPCV
jgi:hypothetical protein